MKHLKTIQRLIPSLDVDEYVHLTLMLLFEDWLENNEDENICVELESEEDLFFHFFSNHKERIINEILR